MILNFLLLIFLSFGLGMYLPSLSKENHGNFGIRLLAGYSLLTCLLFLGIVLLGLGLAVTLYGLIGLACIGCIWSVLQIHSRGQQLAVLVHPVVILPLSIVAVALVHGPITFTPYGDDTYINWLMPAKQMWLVDSYHDDRFISAVVGYLPGWHFLLGFTSPLWGNFSETRAIAAPAALHICVLAAAFDVMLNWLGPSRLTPWRRQAFAYLVLLCLLGAEASWQLLPTLVLSEMPLFYSLIGVFLVGSLMLEAETRKVPVALVLSLVLCAHYLIKTQGIALVPVACGMGFLGYLLTAPAGRRSLLRACLLAVLVVTPTLIVFVSWKAFGPPGAHCATKVTALLGRGLAQLASDLAWDTLAFDILAFVKSYLLTYKAPVSLVALIGLGAGLFDRKLRWVSLAVIAYLAIYLLAVYWTYLSCAGGFNSYLSSLPRYLQLPVRLFHFIGPMLLAAVCVNRLNWRSGGWLERLASGAGLLGIGLLAIYQLTQIETSLRTLKSPGMGVMETYALAIPKQAQALMTWLKTGGYVQPKVLMIYTFYEYLPYIIGLDSGLVASSAVVTANSPLSEWQLEHMRFAGKQDRLPVGREQLALDDFDRFDVLWPLDDAVGFSELMMPLTGDSACAATPTDYVLVRSQQASQPFRCVAKSALANHP